MKIQTLISVGVLTALLAGCGSDDGITLAPTNVSNGGGSNSPGTDNYTGPCAYYEEDGVVQHGTEEGNNCAYTASFVGEANPLVEGTMTIPALANGGVHIFHDSLFIGDDVSETDAQAGVTVLQEGEGAKVEIEAGARLAFSGEDYVRITRGSQIFARGTASAPIIFSGEEDLVDGTANEGDRGLWGGVQINGNGLTNKCEADPNNCHVQAEGKVAHYGGTNNEESSGVLEYVQIRHAGYEVVDGNELNGLTLNAVGSGTTIQYVQAYTTLDDGFEMFGGAVNLKNIVAVNVGDDSIDFSEGYTGDIQYALVIHTSGSNNCVEVDNNDPENDAQPFTKGRISNLTCITSNVAEETGDFPTSKGDSEGVLFRQGTYFELYNSVITSNADNMDSNECVEIVSPRTVAGVDNDVNIARGNVLACGEAFKGDLADARAWWTGLGNAVVDSLPATVIEGLDSNDRAYITAATMTDSASAAVAVLPYDVSQLLDNFAADAIPAEGNSGDSSFFDNVDYIGAVKDAASDWVDGWTVGL